MQIKQGRTGGLVGFKAITQLLGNTWYQNELMEPLCHVKKKQYMLEIVYRATIFVRELTNFWTMFKSLPCAPYKVTFELCLCTIWE
jgi:hypothetical protein